MQILCVIFVKKVKIAYFWQKFIKKYIYTKYIYSKCCIFCIFWQESYGNPMGMLWESYGADS